MTWLLPILNWLGSSVFEKIVEAYRARLQAQNATDAKAVELAVEEIKGEIEQRRTEAALIREEQGWWLTAMIRPMMAMPFIVFAWKVVVWDKVLGLGTTDPLDPNMWSVFLTVVGAYFGGRTIEKVARIFRR